MAVLFMGLAVTCCCRAEPKRILFIVNSYTAQIKKDGSHPSPKGAFLVSCVFFRTLFNDNLESVWTPPEIEKHERETIVEAVQSVQ